MVVQSVAQSSFLLGSSLLTGPQATPAPAAGCSAVSLELRGNGSFRSAVARGFSLSGFSPLIGSTGIKGLMSASRHPASNSLGFISPHQIFTTLLARDWWFETAQFQAFVSFVTRALGNLLLQPPAVVFVVNQELDLLLREAVGPGSSRRYR